MAFRFLLDADISPVVARIARAKGLDVVSVHERGEAGLRDDEQLRRAAAEGRIFVTRNRNDFIRWTIEFAHKLEPHAGVLIVPRSIAAVRPDPLARALVQWSKFASSRFDARSAAPSYMLDYLSVAEDESDH